MFQSLRDRVFTIIRGEANGDHGVIACLRCKWLDNKRNEIEEELDRLDGQAALHVAQRHILQNEPENKPVPLF